MNNTITLPKKTVKGLLEKMQEFQELQDELEDFLWSQNSDFITKMRYARRQDLAGKTRPIHELADKYV